MGPAVFGASDNLTAHDTTGSRVRADRAEATLWAVYARNLNVGDDTRLTGAMAVAGGYALYIQGSFVTSAIGIGTTRALRADDLKLIDEFYALRGVLPRLDVHPAVLARDGALFEGSGYRQVSATALLERELDAIAPSATGAPAVEETDRRTFIEAVLSGSDGIDVDPAMLLRILNTNASAATALVAARVDGMLAGAGALIVYGEAAMLFSTAVKPAFRNRGVQRELIEARLRIAHRRGASYAFLKCEPDSYSERSALGAGFQRSYLRAVLQRPV